MNSKSKFSHASDDFSEGSATGNSYGGAEVETLTEESVPQYTASNFQIVKQQVARCSVRKLQSMYNSAEEMRFNCQVVNGVFVPECNSKETVCAASLGNPL